MRRVRAVGAVDPDAAWERYARPELWPTWAPQIRRVECADARLRAGTCGVVVGPAGLRVRFVVDAVDESARTWLWRARCGPIRLVLGHAVSPTPAGPGPQGTAADVWIDGPAPVVAAYAPLARHALTRLVAPGDPPPPSRPDPDASDGPSRGARPPRRA